MPDPSFDQVKEDIRLRCDIVDVVGGYVRLKRAGASFKGLCPFHREKTPSFNVDPKMQRYHCFGCDAGGDVFNFIMAVEGLDFIGSMKLLAQRAGVAVEWSDSGRRGDGKEKEVLFEIHDRLTREYHRLLLDAPEAEAARRYLEEREFDRQAIRDFAIGYAPKRFDFIQRWGAGQGYSVKQLETAGVLAARERPRSPEDTHYDKFRDRVMFPIRNTTGQVIGFSGRVLDESASPAKYMNSPETPIFKKSQILFAIDRARTAMVRERKAVVCEGQLDAIRCHTAGFAHVVAAQGTALTDQQARILKRFADEVVLVLDADAAGENAALRSAEAFFAAGMGVQVVKLPPGEDPDSLIRRHGPQAFGERLTGSIPFIRFQVETLSGREDPQSDAGFLRVLRDVTAVLRSVPSASLQERMLNEAAELLHITPEVLHRDLRQNAPVRRPAPRPSEHVPPISGPADTTVCPRKNFDLLEVLYHHPKAIDAVRGYLAPDCLEHPDARRIYAHLLERAPRGEEDPMAGLDTSDPDLARLVARVQFSASRLGAELATPADAARQLTVVVRRKAFERERTLARDDFEARKLVMVIAKLREAQFHRDWEKARPILEAYHSE